MYYEVALELALSDAKQVYTQLEKGQIKYKSYKTKIRNIMRKHGSKYENNEIGDFLSYIDIDNVRYYIQNFVAGDFSLQFIVNINVVDFKYENISNINEITEGDLPTYSFANCVHDGLRKNFTY